jgi:hypothetical protein
MGSANFDATNSDIIGAIRDGVKVETIEVADDQFVTRPVHLPPAPPTAKPITIHTLRGIVDYLTKDNQIDKIKPGTTAGAYGLAVHVVDEGEVRIIRQLGKRFREREDYVIAQCQKILSRSFQFGNWYDPETFIIYLRSLFVVTDDVETVIKIVGNLKKSAVVNFDDDGLTQQVTAQKGIATVGNVEVPKVITLQPYRTFRDITQPTAEFFLRLRGGDDEELPEIALFETDGGAWKLDAIENIRAYLAEKVTDVPIIA